MIRPAKRVRPPKSTLVLRNIERMSGRFHDLFMATFDIDGIPLFMTVRKPRLVSYRAFERMLRTDGFHIASGTEEKSNELVAKLKQVKED